jgi:NAD(P)-dependent dehydrogenase (short-subunit alcohol dehydrogenase family)
MSVAGKTIVLTGASSGIGAAAARQLHRLGADVVPVGRSAERTAANAAELGVAPLTADFANLADVRRLAADLLEQCPRIDVLANNAGGFTRRPTRTVDGHEHAFQVNVLAPYLLTRLLTERLQASDGRIITTSSHAHYWVRLNLDGLDTTRQGWPRAYATSKLAGAILTRELARCHPELGVADFHPGVIATSIARDVPILRFLAASPFRRLLTGPNQGAKTLVYLAGTSERLDGGYYASCKRAWLSPAANDPVVARKLWELSARLVGLPA